jgi:hypothetical protein
MNERRNEGYEVRVGGKEGRKEDNEGRKRGRIIRKKDIRNFPLWPPHH